MAKSSPQKTLVSRASIVKRTPGDGNVYYTRTYDNVTQLTATEFGSLQQLGYSVELSPVTGVTLSVYGNEWEARDMLRIRISFQTDVGVIPQFMADELESLGMY